MAKESAVFLDTSIVIALFVHGPQTQKKIRSRLKDFNLAVTSLVVRNEFRRRLLGEARYLLELIEKKNSLIDAQRHVVALPSGHGRKKQICLEFLTSIFESLRNFSDDDAAERAKLLLRSMLKTGMDEFDAMVGHVIIDSNCACGRQSPKQKGRKGRFELGQNKCSAVAKNCGIASFLSLRSDELQRICEWLRATPVKKSDEICQAEVFASVVADDPSNATSLDPCLKVGDFLIALESCKIPCFYTLNRAESQHLCRALQQHLIVRPTNPEKDDEVYSEDFWPTSQVTDEAAKDAHR